MRNTYLGEVGLCDTQISLRQPLPWTCFNCRSKSDKCAIPKEISKFPDGKFYRKTVNSSKELVVYYSGFGWLTSDELFDLRQADPRNAP